MRLRLTRTIATLASAFAVIAPIAAFSQESLPFPPTSSGSEAGPTIAKSKYSPRKPSSHLPANAPNVVIIMLDDVGPALPDTYGGPIHASTLSRIADSGISYNSFHNTAMCSPTRAALLTGRNHHRVGFGQIAELANDWDGYTGHWPATTASVAKVLGYYGYNTAAFGKWHNTPAEETTSQGPFDRWPTGRLVGFDYFYGFLAGESSQWEPAVVENTVRLADHRDQKGYHFTEDMADKAVAWLRRQNAIAPDQPFFMYWAPGASHGPHHIFKEWADKYKGKFDQGWDALREEIFARQKELGWIPANTKLTRRPETLASWDSIPEDEKPFQRRLMEVYAGFTEHADTQAGRLVDELERLGVRDNTLIFYVWGDNGSSAEGQNGTISELLAQNGLPSAIKDHLRALDELGGLDVLGSNKTDNMYHAGWAWAGSMPFQGVKLNAGFFGGTRTPLAVSWPKSIKPDKTPRAQFHHVNDIAPTIYDVLGIKTPKMVDGVTQQPMDGVSMTYTFAGAKTPGRKKVQYFEVMGDRAVYADGWIASAWGPRIPWVPGVPPGIATWTPDKDSWQLYNLHEDFSQSTDLAAKQPQKLAAMKKLFDRQAKDNRVWPVGGGLWSIIWSPQSAPHNPATEFNYTQDVTGVPEFAGPKLNGRSSLVTIDVELKPESAGVLYAQGGFSGGLALWVDKGKLFFEYNLFEIERTRIESKDPLPTGKVKIEVETRVAAPRGAADVAIRINGDAVANGQVRRTAVLGFTANDAFDVGMDSYSPVSLEYFDKAPFAFNGKIETVHVQYTK